MPNFILKCIKCGKETILPLWEGSILNFNCSCGTMNSYEVKNGELKRISLE